MNHLSQSCGIKRQDVSHKTVADGCLHATPNVAETTTLDCAHQYQEESDAMRKHMFFTSIATAMSLLLPTVSHADHSVAVAMSYNSHSHGHRPSWNGHAHYRNVYRPPMQVVQVSHHQAYISPQVIYVEPPARYPYYISAWEAAVIRENTRRSMSEPCEVCCTTLRCGPCP